MEGECPKGNAPCGITYIPPFHHSFFRWNTSENYSNCQAKLVHSGYLAFMRQESEWHPCQERIPVICYTLFITKLEVLFTLHINLPAKQFIRPWGLVMARVHHTHLTCVQIVRPATLLVDKYEPHNFSQFGNEQSIMIHQICYLPWSWTPGEMYALTKYYQTVQHANINWWYKWMTAKHAIKLLVITFLFMNMAKYLWSISFPPDSDVHSKITIFRVPSLRLAAE